MAPRRTIAPYALTTLLVMGVALPMAQADESEAESWGWTAFGGIHGYSDKSKLGDGKDSSISNAFMIGARLWQRLGDIATVEAELPMGVTTSEDQIATLFVTMPRLQGRIRLFEDAAVSPSVVMGGGAPIVTSTKQSSVPSDIQYAGYVGAGLDIRLKGLKLGIEGRYVALPATGEPYLAHEWEVLLSFGRRPRTAKPVVALVPSDRDHDGVEDAKDACPDQREDLDGFEDDDGCPERDNDKDGVIDGLDECQGEAETFNGFKDDDGCPDELSDEVRLVEGVISGLRFEAGSGVMEPDGLAELDKLVTLLKAQPSVRLKLYGHTDDREVPEEELEALGQERADSVRDYLIEKGVGFGRLRSFSRAGGEPFADNSTFSGRRTNRRVEIQILRDDEEDVP